jgi:hypothetical protein
MRLIVEPEGGIGPILRAIADAKTAIDIVIFRLDCPTGIASGSKRCLMTCALAASAASRAVHADGVSPSLRNRQSARAYGHNAWMSHEDKDNEGHGAT